MGGCINNIAIKIFVYNVKSAMILVLLDSYILTVYMYVYILHVALLPDFNLMRAIMFPYALFCALIYSVHVHVQHIHLCSSILSWLIH